MFSASLDTTSMNISATASNKIPTTSQRISILATFAFTDFAGSPSCLAKEPTDSFLERESENIAISDEYEESKDEKRQQERWCHRQDVRQVQTG